MSDRAAEARAEAERQGRVNFGRAAFRMGVGWADANPKPHTITADQCNDIEDAVHEGVPLGHMLRMLGIEVTDDE